MFNFGGLSNWLWWLNCVIVIVWLVMGVVIRSVWPVLMVIICRGMFACWNVVIIYLPFKILIFVLAVVPMPITLFITLSTIPEVVKPVQPGVSYVRVLQFAMPGQIYNLPVQTCGRINYNFGFCLFSLLRPFCFI